MTRTGRRGTEKEARAALNARARPAGIAVIAAFLGWMAASWIGGALGLPVALALAIDIACLAVLGWALMTLIGIWRARRDEGL